MVDTRRQSGEAPTETDLRPVLVPINPNSLFERYTLTMLSSQTMSFCVCASDRAVRLCECISLFPSRIGGLAAGTTVVRALSSSVCKTPFKNSLILRISIRQNAVAAHIGEGTWTNQGSSIIIKTLISCFLSGLVFTTTRLHLSTKRH